MPLPRLDYDGSLLPQHRQRIKLIRETFGLTYQDLAKLLGCDWSTILKWENGSSNRSYGSMTLALKQVFQGELDERLDRKKRRIQTLMEERLQEIIAERHAALTMTQDPQTGEDGAP